MESLVVRVVQNGERQTASSDRRTQNPVE